MSRIKRINWTMRNYTLGLRAVAEASTKARKSVEEFKQGVAKSLPPKHRKRRA